MKLAKEVTPDRWLYLRGPEEAAQQIHMLGTCTPEELTDEQTREWTHRFHLMESDKDELQPLCELLKEVLSLTTKGDLDFAIAFDWYKDPVGDDPMRWPNTPSGELIYRSKYYSEGVARTRARRELLEKFSDLIEEHPLLRECPNIVTVPGHKADGQSFGERLADRVASKTGKQLTRTESPGGTRPQAKEGTATIADGHFEMPGGISGDVIILDDVYRSGTTMNAVARTAKRAGARHAFGLAAVRTMRN
ncbi:ComF family protein [Streptomyces sp. YKOK-I1]